MSWRATAAVKELKAECGISRTGKLVLMCLADYHNDDTQRCDPSVPRLAKDALLSDRQLRTVLHRLDHDGFISIEERSGRPSNYSLLCIAKGFTHAKTAGATPEAITAAPPLKFRASKLQDTPEVSAPDPGSSYFRQTVEPQENLKDQREEQPQGARAPVEFHPMSSPAWPDDEEDGVSFASMYVLAYRRNTGRDHPGASVVADCRSLERDFGRDACVQIAADHNWEKHPNWLRPKLNDRARHQAVVTDTPPETRKSLRYST